MTAVLQMKPGSIKRISVDKLCKQMYVCGCGSGDIDKIDWVVTAEYVVTSDAQIQGLRQQYTHVWIDTGRGVDVLPAAGAALVSVARRPDREPVPPASDRQSRHIPERAVIRKARNLRERSTSIVSTLMEDIRLGRTLELRGARAAVDETIHQVLKNSEAMVYLALLKSTDTSLAQRAVNTCILALAFAKCLSIPKKDLSSLGLGALLYDVGMTRIPEGLRNKTGPLDEAEFSNIKDHVNEGIRLLKAVGDVSRDTLSIVRTHHERFDGSGYPAGLKGKEIGLLDRMVALVSVYSALTSDRPHARAVSMKAALVTLYDECGKGFDTRLVHKFIQCIGVYPPGCPVLLNTGEMGVVVAVNGDYRLHPVVRIDIDGDQSPLEQSRLLDLALVDNRDRIIKRVLEPGEYRIEVSADGETDRLRLVSGVSR